MTGLTPAAATGPRPMRRLEAEGGLEINLAIRGGRAAARSGQTGRGAGAAGLGATAKAAYAIGYAIGHAEERRSQRSDGRGKVHVIKDIASVDAEHDAIAARCARAAEAAATARGRAYACRASAAPLPSATILARAHLSRGAFGQPAEAEGFGDAQVQRKLARAGEIVDGDDGLAGSWLRIESTEGRTEDAAGNLRDRTGRRRDKAGTLVKERSAGQILAQGDVVRHSGTSHHERAEAQAIAQSYGAAEENPAADVEGRAAVVRHEIVGIGGKTIRSGGVATGVVQRVVGIEREFGSGTDCGVEDQLVLPEDAGRFVLIDVFRYSVGVDAAVASGGRHACGGSNLCPR